MTDTQVKLRFGDERKWHFLGDRGRVAQLRIHAVTFNDPDKARLCAERLLAENDTVAATRVVRDGRTVVSFGAPTPPKPAPPDLSGYRYLVAVRKDRGTFPRQEAERFVGQRRRVCLQRLSARGDHRPPGPEAHDDSWLDMHLPTDGLARLRAALRPQPDMEGMMTTCEGCVQPISHDDDGLLVDSTGDAFCERRYDGCGACQDGEPHPHWTNGGLGNSGNYEGSMG